MTQYGYWRDTRANNNRLALSQPQTVNNVWYIAPQGGVAPFAGSKLNTFLTFSDLAPHLRSRDLVVLCGVLREQAVAPLGVFDVTIVGGANRPRQATSDGVPTGGGASWLAPTSPVAATPLLELRQQGWTIENIQFAGPSDDACIKMHREETTTYPDASHLSLRGCRFTGGLIGLEDYGGHSNVLIEDCSFEDLSGVGGGAIVVTNQGIAIPSRWMVRNSRFLPSVNGIVGAWVDSQFIYNQIYKMTTTTINAASGNTGLRNMFIYNNFNIAAADFDPAGGVTGNATDQWISILTDTIEQGVPAN